MHFTTSLQSSVHGHNNPHSGYSKKKTNTREFTMEFLFPINRMGLISG